MRLIIFLKASSNTGRPLAFAFDIDGVLIRGGEALPAAKEALSIINGNNALGLKIPYILLTNGGGVSEVERCRKLSIQLGVQIDPAQYIQAHTILKTVAHKYADVPVLVLGGKGDTVRKVAEGYGFNEVYNTLDILAWNPSVWPLHTLTQDEHLSVKSADFSQISFAAIFVFHDPRNWALDIQVICDVIQSGGIVGGPYLSDHGRSPVDLVFCNPDLIWRSDFERPRLGQGAFKDAFQTVFKSLTGSNYPHVLYGKPTMATYSFAEMVLKDRLRGQLPSVFPAPDNPESDIAGANAAQWKSILVHTGVYNPQQGPPSHQPTHEAEDVVQAVRWALDQEFDGEGVRKGIVA
ncbi:HAD-superfamily hydrolase [Leucogyrophana mollusca]|uniref:HAD-superfamily hydrolase n=1 Tax=Leucogyrophana mollusca TaxID=85980 RepID=A0ACB8B720_9AGAM|nr:HAD-superfamily hydrolase [Leucogyrophana mollusca]